MAERDALRLVACFVGAFRPARATCLAVLPAAVAGGCHVNSGNEKALVSRSADSESDFASYQLGQEHSISRHLQDGEEFRVDLPDLLGHGHELFRANWTVRDGQGRPFSNGLGHEIADTDQPLVFPRNFNRISGPDASSCADCHNAPFGIAGGGGGFVTNVFVMGQRFDAVTFDPLDTVVLRGTVDEQGKAASLDRIANSRATIGMFGSGLVEMLARQMTAELQALRDHTTPGNATALVTKGVSFGILSRRLDGSWDTSSVAGLPAPSVASAGSQDPPSLVIQPFHQAGAVISLRQFTNNSFNHHHGIQSTERFGLDRDPDGDGVVNELSRADVTAVTLFQATLPVPGRVIPRHPMIERAVLDGEQAFAAIGCAGCHIPALPLDSKGWVFTEPNPFNPPGNLRPGEAPPIDVDLTSDQLPGPRLSVGDDGVLWVPAYTDLKLHDITWGPKDPNSEPLDMLQPPGSAKFFAGNRRFITKKLWGAANEPPYGHHGLFTTLREAIFAHAGEAQAARAAFDALDGYEQAAIIEFLKTLQVLPPGTSHRIVDEKGRPRSWPPRGTAGDDDRDDDD